MVPPQEPGPGGPKPPPKMANQKTQAEFAMEELRKTAKSRGIPVEKLIAQMVQQYLKEDGKEGWDGKI